MDQRSYREVAGKRLRAFREERGISIYKLAQKGGIRISQVQAVESGDTNYTIDSFLGYIAGSDLYIYFAEKSENREMPHDFEDLADKAIKNDPLK